MKSYTTQDLELATELLADQNRKDRYGQNLWSWSNIQWAILVQMWFDRMKITAHKLHKRFKFSMAICMRWAMRSSQEGTFKQLVNSL